MTEQQIRATAEEIAKEFYPHDTKAVWRPSLAETAERVIRRHATTEAVAMPKCLDCGEATYLEQSGREPLFAVACHNVVDKCMRGAFRRSREDAIAAYARLCVRDAKPADATKPPEPKFDLPDCRLCGKPPEKSEYIVDGERYRCANEFCRMYGIYTADQWSQLHAPNRLTLSVPLADGGATLYPVAFECGDGGQKICTLHSHPSNADADRNFGRRVLAPIHVEVTVKP